MTRHHSFAKSSGRKNEKIEITQRWQKTENSFSAISACAGGCASRKQCCNRQALTCLPGRPYTLFCVSARPAILCGSGEQVFAGAGREFLRQKRRPVPGVQPSWFRVIGRQAFAGLAQSSLSPASVAGLCPAMMRRLTGFSSTGSVFTAFLKSGLGRPL